MSDTNYVRGGDRTRYGSQACAACKFQRRKCGPKCPLAPFFPSHSCKVFVNARKLFGVKNILKILANVSPDKRTTAVKTLIDEANARAADPVGGSYRVICQLRRQIEDCKTELDDVTQQLAICRAIADPCSLYPIGDGLNSQDSFAQQFDGSSCSCLTLNSKQPLEYQRKNSIPLMGLIQQPPASISRGLEQHRRGMVSLAEGEDTEPEIKLEDCFTHLLPQSW